MRVAIAAWTLGAILVLGSYGSAQESSPRALRIRADSQEANAATGVITARGNVGITYPAENVQAQAQLATYYTREQRIVLEGQVLITQDQNQLRAEKVTYLVETGEIQAEPQGGDQVESVYVFPETTSAPSN
jgi:lipopolysaccharide export system protein LptA